MWLRPHSVRLAQQTEHHSHSSEYLLCGFVRPVSPEHPSHERSARMSAALIGLIGVAVGPVPGKLLSSALNDTWPSWERLNELCRGKMGAPS
jgi:hypothetical protein